MLGLNIPFRVSFPIVGKGVFIMLMKICHTFSAMKHWILKDAQIGMINYTDHIPNPLFNSMKWKCRHFDEIFILGCSCQNDNFQCSKWWLFHRNEEISISVNLLFHIIKPVFNYYGLSIHSLKYNTCHGYVWSNWQLCRYYTSSNIHPKKLAHSVCLLCFAIDWC